MLSCGSGSKWCTAVSRHGSVDDAVLESDFAVCDSHWREQVGISSGLDLGTHFDLKQSEGDSIPAKNRTLSRPHKDSKAIRK
jgi:hypothetical protein